MTTFEYLTLPNEDASKRYPINQEVTLSGIWDRQRVRIVMDWNNAGVRGRWFWKVVLVNHGTIIPRTPALYDWPYYYRDYLCFLFGDLSRKATRVTPENLGDSVKLFVFPGPASPNYEDWRERQDDPDIVALTEGDRTDRTKDTASGLIF